MSNDKGENLLEPGKTPHQNLRFLAMISIVLKAVHDRADVLRASIASPGNDHRLGANEAPPAIISVFLGTMLENILVQIEKGEVSKATEALIINLGVSQIPDISKDYTDRNRTSPFAFTGNKFEFRAVGSSANCAVPISVLNAAVAEAFVNATARLKELLSKKSNRDEAVMELIRENAKATKPVRFEGNGYSEEWQKEAKKRGLPILPSTVEALEVFNTKSSVEFLTKTNVLTAPEIASRYHIAVERYVKTVEIEVATLVELATQYVVPAVETQLGRISDLAKTMTSTPLKALHTERVQVLEVSFEEILKHLKGVKSLLDGLHHSAGDEASKMKMLASEILPEAGLLRKACDTAESLVADELWQLPKYREMLFTNSIT